MLANNPITGAIALGALAVSGGWLFVCSAFGLCVSTLFAIMLGVNTSAIRNGLMGYNGLLVGGGISVALGGGDWNPRALVFIFFGALFTVFAMLALGNAWASHLGAPAFTFPFILVTWTLIAVMHSAANFPPSLPGLTPGFGGGTPALQSADAGLVFSAWMAGIGQIYVAPSPYSGAMLVVGMALYSRVSALAMMLGSMIGLSAAFAFGLATNPTISAGLAGYNPSLLMIAVFGVFFVPSVKLLLVAIVGSYMSCFASAALTVVLKPIGLPQLTFAFSCSALCCVLIQLSLSNVAAVPLGSVTTPEAHWRKTQILRRVLRRFRRN